jgi:hypothetical protein
MMFSRMVLRRFVDDGVDANICANPLQTVTVFLQLHTDLRRLLRSGNIQKWPGPFLIRAVRRMFAGGTSEGGGRKGEEKRPPPNGIQ